MLLFPRWLLKKVRLRLSRTSRDLGAWVEPRDPAFLASRLDRGEIVWRAFAEAGSALRRCDRFLEADRMLERGLGAFPDDATLLFEYAMAAHNSGRYELAINRWERALRADPERAMNHCGLAANLRETRDFARAQGTIGDAMTKFPDDLVIVSEAARIADAQGLFARSLPLWSRAARTPDAPVDWLQGEAHALMSLGRFEEADDALKAAAGRHPEAPGLLVVAAMLAARRGDRSGALALWRAYLERFPDDALAREAFERVAAQAGTAAPREPAGAAPAVAGTDDTLRTLLLGFESLGDGCEFGTLQRRFSADVGGLLGCNKVTLDSLVAALGQRFAGLGEPANTELAIEPDGEYVVQDRRWGLGRHTSAFASQADVDALYAKTCRSIESLRDSFLAELAAGQKVFVYRSEGLDGDELELLHRALRAFGPVRLLNVQPAAPTAPTSFEGRAGDLLTVGQGLHVGFVERLGSKGTGGRWDIAFGDWISVCTKVAALG